MVGAWHQNSMSTGLGCMHSSPEKNRNVHDTCAVHASLARPAASLHQPSWATWHLLSAAIFTCTAGAHHYNRPFVVRAAGHLIGNVRGHPKIYVSHRCSRQEWQPMSWKQARLSDPGSGLAQGLLRACRIGPHNLLPAAPRLPLPRPMPATAHPCDSPTHVLRDCTAPYK